MQAAISASTQPMAAALRTVLNGFHQDKAAPGVDALLLRLYRPILFRALAAANPSVRRNALGVLLDAFPLQVGHTAISQACLQECEAAKCSPEHVYKQMQWQCSSHLHAQPMVPHRRTSLNRVFKLWYFPGL